MPVSLLEDFAQRTGANIMEGYGMTETIAVATTHYFFGDRKVGSVGMRIPYQRIRIANIDDNGNIIKECATNEIGAILHSGISTFPGYKQQDANRGAWPEERVFNSGDMGRLDEDGYLWLVGRAKDLIIRGGHNIDPLVTEDALATHAAVELAAAVGRPDVYAGEVPVAFVQLVEGASASTEELKIFAREHVSERAAAPVEVIICGALPVTAVGKIYKPELRKRAIRSAFHSAITTALPEAEFTVHIADDKRSGIKVMLEVTGVPITPALSARLQAALQHFTQTWQLIGPET
jgi:fatty-acyl-CoA synthase